MTVKTSLVTLQNGFGEDVCFVHNVDLQFGTLSSQGQSMMRIPRIRAIVI